MGGEAPAFKGKPGQEEPDGDSYWAVYAECLRGGFGSRTNNAMLHVAPRTFQPGVTRSSLPAGNPRHDTRHTESTKNIRCNVGLRGKPRKAAILAVGPVERAKRWSCYSSESVLRGYGADATPVTSLESALDGGVDGDPWNQNAPDQRSRTTQMHKEGDLFQ
ncbi:hypothetical protein PybrP1_010730 [[Pythium] brassicae (nom. inval.)]|nr:hypothetical protein PybrP1_010730 [[Pythium] brassicae (nom. inval.)]